jgi:light-regulated signal transduction histidine kinase (bacteriophytochrome)
VRALLGLRYRTFATVAALALFAVVTAARFASDVPGDGWTFLYVAPIALLAVAFGLTGGAIAAAVGIALSLAWVLAEDPGVTTIGVLTRSLAFAIVGGVVGAYADRARRALDESAHQRAELERSNLELDRFASVASHDLSEPLRTVTGLAQLLEKRYQGQLDDTGDELIHHIVAGTTRMQRLLDGLLQYSRAGRGGTPRDPVELGSVLRAVVRDLEVRIEETQATVMVDELPRVHGDRTQLEQLFQNLVANALTHRGGQPPYVEVGADRDDGAWTVRVADRGPGVPEAERDAIFGMFARGSLSAADADPEDRGSGVGLAVVAKIATNHGGSVWVEPNEGRGSVFRVRLPD